MSSLFSRLGRCALCGGPIVVGGGRPRLDGCSHFPKRGVCPNDLAQPVPVVEGAFLAALDQEVLTPERFRYALQVGLEHLGTELATHPDERPALEREKITLTCRSEWMVEAIGDGRGRRRWSGRLTGPRPASRRSTRSSAAWLAPRPSARCI